MLRRHLPISVALLSALSAAAWASEADKPASADAPLPGLERKAENAPTPAPADAAPTIAPAPPALAPEFAERLARWADNNRPMGPISPGRYPGLSELCPFGAVRVPPKNPVSPGGAGLLTLGG